MINLAYICSAARSGSTLLNQLIGTHPNALPAGEIARLSKNIALNTICSCGDPVRKCAFWLPTIDKLGRDIGKDLWKDPYALDLGFIRAVSEVDRGRQTRWYLVKRSAYMGWLELLNAVSIDTSKSYLSSQYQHWIRENLRVQDALRERSGRSVVVDSSKGFRIAAGLYRSRPESTRIILLARDGRGVIASYLRSGASLRDSVKNWKVYYERSMRWMERNVAPEHVLHVHYEDLVRNPDEALGRIFAFLGLPAMRKFDDERRSEGHILAGNRGTLRSSGINSDERWKSELSSGQIDYFWKLAGPTMDKLGYATGGSAPRSASHLVDSVSD